jgi:hypothetical protein
MQILYQQNVGRKEEAIQSCTNKNMQLSNTYACALSRQETKPQGAWSRSGM